MEIPFYCEFCEKPIKTEANFIKHKCKQMLRESEFLSLFGQSAWRYYKEWIKLKHTRSTCSSSTFKTSRFFDAFYKFAVFVNKNTIPSATEFVKLMTHEKISPVFWTKPEAYSKYLNHMSCVVSPTVHINITIKTICNIADSLHIETSDVFNELIPNEVIHMMRQHLLSPWVLLNSKKFNLFFVNNTTPEEKILFGSLIDSTHWKRKFSENPKIVNMVKKYTLELGI